MEAKKSHHKTPNSTPNSTHKTPNSNIRNNKRKHQVVFHGLSSHSDMMDMMDDTTIWDSTKYNIPVHSGTVGVGGGGGNGGLNPKNHERGGSFSCNSTEENNAVTWAQQQLYLAKLTLGNSNAFTLPKPAHELLRRKAASKLRSALLRGVRQANRNDPKRAKNKPPPLAYERWAARDVLRRTTTELLLPSSGVVDPALARDLSRHTMRGADAQALATSLADEAKTAADALKTNTENEEERKQERIYCTKCGAEMLAVALGAPEAKPYFTVSDAHYKKLKMLYDDNEGSDDEQAFLRALFCLLCRYDALGGAGYQCALPNKCFDAMRKAVCANGECFASPLNCRTHAYCSAFPDTDGAFGSAGSFRNFYPEFGSFEANPIFVPETMSMMATHCESLLEAAEQGKPGKYDDGNTSKAEDKKQRHCGKPRSLSFCVVVPVWKECKFYGALMRSAFRRGEPIVLSAEHHVYVDGAQHARPSSERERPSSYDTAIFFLQTKRASDRWPCGEEQRVAIRQAFAGDILAKAKSSAGASSTVGEPQLQWSRVYKKKKVKR